MNQSRRDFIKGATSVGAFVPVARCLAGFNVYTPRISNEQVLKVQQIEIPVGLGKPFKAFHISDTHLNFFDAADFASASSEKREFLHYRWCRFPQALQSFYASLDYAAVGGLPLLHTGDLVDYASDGNDRVLKRSVLGINMHFAIGNHEYQNCEDDHYAKDKSAARSRLQPFFRNDLAVASRVMGGVNFVAFDNALHNLSPEVVNGVKREFEKGIPVVLMCHVPPTYTMKFRENARESKRRIAVGMGADPSSLPLDPLPDNPADSHDEITRSFYEWLKGRKALKAILCGHTHYAEIDDFSESAKMYVAGGNYEGHAYEITFT